MAKLIIKATHGYRTVDTKTNKIINYGDDYYISVKAFEKGKGICALSEDAMERISNGAYPETVGYTRDMLRKEVREYLENEFERSVPDAMVDDVCLDILNNNTGEDVMTTLDCFCSGDEYLNGLEDFFVRKIS